MNIKPYDIVVIGSGPAGAVTARVAAERGLRVLLIDKRQELGAPIQCSGAISRHALTSGGVAISEEFVHEAIYGFGIYDEAGSATRIDYRVYKPEQYGDSPGKNPLGYVVDRRRFDRYLMTQAERAGAEVWLKTEGLGFVANPSGYATVKLRRFNRALELQARVVVGADGLQSQVGRWAGLRTHIRMTELASCLQYIVDQVDTEGLLEIITGHEWAPGGYAWVFPKGHGYAEVGLGVIRPMTQHNAQWHLDQFLERSFMRERFANARILEIQGGGVPLAAPLRRQYSDNLILVGDAARHVNPITGGGLHTAISAGHIAGQYLADLLSADRLPSAANLEGYQARWLDAMGEKMWKLYREKTAIFRIDDLQERNARLHSIMSDYFHPESEYKKI